MFGQTQPLRFSTDCTHNHSFVEGMRTNIKQLNRSMNSIEKMIAQSRKIIMESKQNSISRNGSIEKSQDCPRRVIGSPAQRHEQLAAKKFVLPASPNIRFSYHPDSPSNRSNSHNKISKMTFGSNSKCKAIDTHQTSIQHQNNLAKFQPNIVKKGIQLRRSGVEEKVQSSKVVQELSTPKQKEKVEQKLNTPVTEPYQRVMTQNNEIYKFSPLRTASRDRKYDHDQSSRREAVPKIKIKATPRTKVVQNNPKTAPKPSARTKKVKVNNPNIRIQDDQEEDPTLEQSSYIEESSYEQQNLKYRYKTQYNQEETSFLIKNYKYESPIPKSYRKKIGQRKKVNLRLFDSNDPKKESSIPSYRNPQVISHQLSRCTPRQHRQNLVQELEQLETASQSQQQRKAKFILKIRKYGFVEKYLTESEIWVIYDHLIWTNVPQLKWPIFIVDEVYKKMKSIQ